MWESVRVSLSDKTEVNAGVSLLGMEGVNMWDVSGEGGEWWSASPFKFCTFPRSVNWPKPIRCLSLHNSVCIG